jgi:hypothetical protein
MLGSTFGREILYLVRNSIRYTHLGCFSASGGAGAGARAFGNAFQASGFPIRQAVPVGLLGLRLTPGLVGPGFS